MPESAWPEISQQQLVAAGLERGEVELAGSPAARSAVMRSVSTTRRLWAAVPSLVTWSDPPAGDGHRRRGDRELGQRDVHGVAGGGAASSSSSAATSAAIDITTASAITATVPKISGRVMASRARCRVAHRWDGTSGGCACADHAGEATGIGRAVGPDRSGPRSSSRQRWCHTRQWGIPGKGCPTEGLAVSVTATGSGRPPCGGGAGRGPRAPASRRPLRRRRWRRCRRCDRRSTRRRRSAAGLAGSHP